MEDAYKLKTISNIIAKDIKDMSGVPHPCQYSDLCRYDPTQICDESSKWLKDLDKKIPIWSRLYLSNCVGHSRELGFTKERNYNVEIPQRLYSLWGSADTHSLVADKMWRLEKYQLVCNVLICCAALKYNLNEWSSSLLDDIVFRGSLIFAELCQKHKIINREFRINHMSTLMEFRNTYYKVLIEEKANGFIYIPYGLNEYNLARALSYFIRFYQFGILECRQRFLAFGFATDVDKGYFMYDCQCIGEPFLDDNQANACVLRTNHLQILLYCMIVSLNVSVENVRFKIYHVDVLIEDPKERRARKHVYVPTITSPVKVNRKDAKEKHVPAENETILQAANKIFLEFNNKKDKCIRDFNEKNSEVEFCVNNNAILREPNQSNQIFSETMIKELPKMEQKILDQGDYEVSLPIAKSDTNHYLLAEIDGNESVSAERTAAYESNISYQFPKYSYNSPSKASSPTPIKTSPKNIKKLFERCNLLSNDNQTNINDDFAHFQDPHLGFKDPKNSTNSCQKGSSYNQSAKSYPKINNNSVKQLNPAKTDGKQQTHSDFRTARKSFQTTSDLKSNSSGFNRKIIKNTIPTSFVAKINQNKIQILQKTNKSVINTESMETLKPSNSCTEINLKLEESLKEEKFARRNSYKDSKNNQKPFSSNERKWNNSNERNLLDPKHKTPKEKKFLQYGCNNFPHLTGKKLSSHYGSKHKIPTPTCKFKTRSYQDSKINQKTFSSDDKKWNNSNERNLLDPKHKTPKEKKFLQYGCNNFPHLTLSSPYGSKNKILPTPTCNFTTRLDSDLIELYDVTKPNILGLKVYLVDNRPQKGACNEVKIIPNKIRVVKIMV